MVRFISDNNLVIGTSLKVIFSSLHEVKSIKFLGWDDAKTADSCDIFIARDPLARFRSLYKDKFMVNMPDNLQACQREAFTALITPMSVATYIFQNLPTISDMHYWEQTRQFESPGEIIQIENTEAINAFFARLGSEPIHTNRTSNVQLDLDVQTCALIREAYKKDYELLNY